MKIEIPIKEVINHKRHLEFITEDGMILKADIKDRMLEIKQIGWIL